MAFGSITFLFKFLPASLALYYIAPQKLKNFAMLTASLFFYAWGAPLYAILLIFVIVLDYFYALRVAGKKDVPMLARRSFIYAVSLNVLLLMFFKYHGFFIGALNSFWPRKIPYKILAFPPGISFYIFQGISYLADVYKEKAEPLKNPLDLALYISMFPQIGAGPIVRYADIAQQLTSRKTSARKFGAGAQKFIAGLAKAVILAGGMKEICDEVTRLEAVGFSVLTAWVGCVSFAFCIYFYFSGYSDMAEGLAKMFGFDFHRNFDYPYAALSVTGFWRRWNISVTTWFRRYVYIPLSKSRSGTSRDTWNLFIVWAFIGMWHGGTLNFLLWGLYHGILLVLENSLFKKTLKRMSPSARRFFTLALITMGWVFFFSRGVGSAFWYMGTMFGIGTSGVIDAQGLFLISSNLLLYILAVLASTPAALSMFRKIYLSFKSLRAQKVAAAALYTGCFLISLAFLSAGTSCMFSGFGF